MTTKLSSAQLVEILGDTSNTLRAVTAERDHFKKMAESYELKQKVEKLAAAMHEKGLDDGVSTDELAARLEKAAEQGKLATIEAAVDMVAPDMGTKIAQLTDVGRHNAGPNSTQLEQFLLGDVG